VEEPGADGSSGRTSSREIELSLFDLENDPNETTNVIDSQPEVAERLKKYAEAHKSRFYE
jgi:arylsulfatase A